MIILRVECGNVKMDNLSNIIYFNLAICDFEFRNES